MSQAIDIRAYQPGDAEPLYEAVEETRDLLSAWMPWCTDDYCLETAKEWLGSLESSSPDPNEYRFAVVDQADNHLGGVGLSQINWPHKFANLGYWVRASARGRGVATAAIQKVSEFAFAKTDLTRLEIVVAVENQASLRVADKAGAHREEILRDRLCVHGKIYDAAMYSIVKSSFDLN